MILTASSLLGLLALLVAAIAILPGSLGVLKWTHTIAARPAGAHFIYVVSVPLYGIGASLLAASAYLTSVGRGSWPLTLLIVAGFAGLSAFGFLVHTRFLFHPIRNPTYISLEEAIRRFGEQEEITGVVDRGGRAYGYVTRLLCRPHIVFQPEGDSLFLLSHCILSHSSMAYELGPRFSPGRIFISSVLANNLVFYDPKNRCSFIQIQNQSMEEGQPLECLPTVIMSLKSWRELYPESKVWVRQHEWRDTFYLKLLARASVIDPSSPDLVYPLARTPDPRLPLKSYVMGVKIGAEAKAYSADVFRREPVLEDVLGGTPLVFFSTGGGDCVHLFSRKLSGGKTLSFRPAADGKFTDLQTSSSWDAHGSCISGQLAGSRLAAIPHYNKIFWFVWSDFHPSTGCYAASESAARPA